MRVLEGPEPTFVVELTKTEVEIIIAALAWISMDTEDGMKADSLYDQFHALAGVSALRYHITPDAPSGLLVMKELRK